VVGSHSRAGLGGKVCGSVSRDVADRSQRPVLIVRPGRDSDGNAVDSHPAAAAHAAARE
jgi:hypothetical protein